MNKEKILNNADIANTQELISIANDGHFRVAIFGSARIKPENEIYQQIVELSKWITKEKYDIVTGGGPGAMEAASYGHKLADHEGRDSKAIGINIQLPFEQKANPYLDFTSMKSTFSDRLDAFVLLSQVFVVTPGGIGTLLELFYTWQLMQVHHICTTPIILWGDQYAPLLDYIKKEVIGRGYANAGDANFVVQVDTIDQVFELLKIAHKNFETAGKNACVNLVKYQAGVKKLGWIKE